MQLSLCILHNCFLSKLFYIAEVSQKQLMIENFSRATQVESLAYEECLYELRQVS